MYRVVSPQRPLHKTALTLGWRLNLTERTVILFSGLFTVESFFFFFSFFNVSKLSSFWLCCLS